MIEQLLIRYSEPTKYDHAPQGTVCKCVNPLSHEFTIYVQMSEDDAAPLWHELGIFTEKDIDYIIEKVATLIPKKVS